MVQDLQAVNKAVVPCAPTVPDPRTLLNDLKPENKFFSVVDISNTFFSIPVHPDSQFWFTFTYRMKGYTYNGIPQGYCESPTIFSQIMSANLAKFNPPKGSQVLLYVDDILLPTEMELDCKTDTLALLKFLPHAVSVMLLQNKISYLSPSRHLSWMQYYFPKHI